MFSPDLLLDTPQARRLFHEVAAPLPLIDYHTHLDQHEILEDRRYENLADVWLATDHYKWRLMRANGVPEELVTGDADPREKFRAFAATLAQAFRHPVHQWCHLELHRVFGIDRWLEPASADAIYDETAAALRDDPSHSARGLLRRFRIEAVCTTDDPAAPLDGHLKCAAEIPDIAIYPTFRPDAAMRIDDPAFFNDWCARLAATEGDATAPNDFDALADLLDRRHASFHEAGCRMSDHGPPALPTQTPDPPAAARAFATSRNGDVPAAADAAAFRQWLLLHTATLNHKRGWAMQLHLGPVRNPNSRLFARKGPDAGADTMSDQTQSGGMLAFLEHLSRAGTLPKIIAYNLNPNDNTSLCAAMQSFQDGTIPGKLQFGAAWWFNDHLEGMRAHFETISAQGLAGRFLGMLTDSRSLLSGVRHELFRRLICGILGRDAAAGLVPGGPLLDQMVANICYQNARTYLGLPCHRK